MSNERAPIDDLLRAEQSVDEVSVIESGSLPGFGGAPLHHHGFERYFVRMVAERRDEKSPEWALQPVPEPVVGPSIARTVDDDPRPR